MIPILLSATRPGEATAASQAYGALDEAVRGLIKEAERRAIGNKRKTLKANDL